MATNAYGEPMPKRLTGAAADAWSLIMVNQEWFDGEDAIAAGVQSAFLREWAENAPARMTVRSYDGPSYGATSHRYFPTIRAAWAEAVATEQRSNGRVSVDVIPVSRVSIPDRGFVPRQYVPAKWPESRW
jgi:hypothetical protein